MSMRPSGCSSPSIGCRRSASQAPPVYRPIIAVPGLTSGLSSAASLGRSCSASGSFIEILLDQELRGMRVEALAAREARRLAAAVGRPHPALDFGAAVALVDHLDGHAEAPGELAREALGAARGLVGRAILAERAPDDEKSGLPLLHELLDRGEAARRGRRAHPGQRMRAAGFALADRDADALKAEIESEYGAGSGAARLLRHVPPDRRGAHSRARAARAPPAIALRPAGRR